MEIYIAIHWQENQKVFQDLLGPFPDDIGADYAAYKHSQDRYRDGVGYNYSYAFLSLIDGKLSPIMVEKINHFSGDSYYIRVKDTKTNEETTIGRYGNTNWSKCIDNDLTEGVNVRDLQPGMIVRNERGGYFPDLEIISIERVIRYWTETKKS